MQKLLNWFIYSSQNPEDFSLTLKGLLVANAVMIIGAIKFFSGFQLPYDNYIELVGLGVGALGGLFSLFGLVRKFWNTAKLYFKKN